ncbi:hypothetical protein [Salinimicrobium sp. TH3]|uniref:hypothetical protein n=1 Tax=Salinimicrobium sp. TH3 TaxID=2997342 RepID=UPI002274BA7B|nr:hypothetical protein [Salinimicrobium sp. TH3]MCY2687467.1 hypothetical protein [Salinimicrobium sp. TH3]
MKISYLLLFIAIGLFTLPVFGQFRVKPVEKKQLDPNELSEEAIDRLKNSQTVFFYRADDDLIELRKALEDVWTISDLILIPFSEAGSIDLTGKSFFVIEGLRKVVKQYATVDNSYLFLHLYMSLPDKNGKEFVQSFARLDLFPSEEAMRAMATMSESEIFVYLYGDAEINNWTPGFLRNYFRNINDLLEKGEGKGLYKGIDDVPAIARMANKTLYIPEYALEKRSKMFGLVAGSEDPEKLMKNYPYPHEFKTACQISDAIIAGEDFYYLVYTRSSSEKFFTVFHSTSGEIVFNAYKPMSYNLKSKDLKDVAKAVKKMKKKEG